MIPELRVESCRVEELLEEQAGAKTLFVSDPFNAPVVRRFGEPIVVENLFHRVALAEIAGSFERVIAVGGCSSLDVGRYYARGRHLIVIPTILSTSCISVNISIIRSREQKTLLKTGVPEQVIVPLRTLLDTPHADLSHWSASGLGDLFANISACLDFEVKGGDIRPERILANAAEALEALDWVLHEFERFDEGSLRRLAHFLHNSSVGVILRGDTALSAGIEHHLYEALIRRQEYSNRVQTHGILVALGTLLTVSIFERSFHDFGLLPKLYRAFSKLGIPATYPELSRISIEREHLVDALEFLWEADSFVIRHLKEHGFAVLDDVFGSVAGIRRKD